LLHNVVLHEHISDKWQWMLEPTHGYSVCEVYHLLTASYEMMVTGHW